MLSALCLPVRRYPTFGIVRNSVPVAPRVPVPMAMRMPVMPVNMAVAHAAAVAVVMMVMMMPAMTMPAMMTVVAVTVVVAMAHLLDCGIGNRCLRQLRRGRGRCEKGARNESGCQYQLPQHGMRPFG